MARALLADGATAPVGGFKSKAGKEFRAALVLDAEGQVTFSFPQPPELGSCPACHRPVRLRGGEKKVYTCDSGRECPFVVPTTMRGREIPEEAVRELLAAGRSRPLDGFAGPGGREGVAGPEQEGVLEWNGSRVVVTLVDARTETGAAGPCPRCAAAVSFHAGRRAWRCEGGCGFQIPALVARRELGHGEVADLLAKGRTARLHGFRQKKGTVFKAALVLDEKGEISFDFARGPDDDDAPVPRGGPPPAFGERLTCPICLSRAETEPGYVVAGREAWGCSRWREGCKLRVPFEVQGTRIPDEEARRLFSSKKATRFLDEPLGPPGKRKTCRVVLRPGDEPCWAVEPRRPRSP
jgi:ssDNA-binding Zn-finger/Zn-ribbon topoisomerase 1